MMNLASRRATSLDTGRRAAPLTAEYIALDAVELHFALLNEAKAAPLCACCGGVHENPVASTLLAQDAAAPDSVLAFALNDAPLSASPPVVSEQEPNNSRGSPQPIDRGTLQVSDGYFLSSQNLPSVTIRGSVGSTTDLDVFSITLAAGELLILDVDFTSGGLDSLLRVYGPDGVELGDGDGFDDSPLDSGSSAAPYSSAATLDSAVSFRAPTAGTYTFSIGAWERGSSGSYELHVSIGPVATSEQILNEDIQSLLSGHRWNTSFLTFGFPQSTADYPAGSLRDNEPTAIFQGFNGAQQAAVRAVLDGAASFTNLGFGQASTPASANLRYAESDAADPAYAYLPTGSISGGTSFYRSIGDRFDNPVVGTYAFMTLLHETGHALGLKHGHELPALSYFRDSMEYSVMTYRGYTGDPLTDGGYRNERFGYAQTFMMLDIAALQRLYGADFSTNGGDSVYSWNPFSGQMTINGVAALTPGDNRVFATIWDGGGNDTYDLSAYGNDVSIDLRPGEWTLTSQAQLANLGLGNFARGNVANALLFNGDQRSMIENAVGGAGSDVITGNLLANRLDGGNGNDRIDGAAGNDTLIAGAGSDTLLGGDGDDAFLLQGFLDINDRIDGGAGTGDQLGLLGDYAGGTILGASTIDEIESIVFLAGGTFDYLLITHDANIDAGEVLTVTASALAFGNDLYFDGRAETDGGFRYVGGLGSDTLFGGLQSDGFYFGDGRYNPLVDTIYGNDGVGDDQFGLDGNYSGANAVVLAPGSLNGIETIVVFGDFDYEITTVDANVTSGRQMRINAGQLLSGDSLVFNGGAESDGSFFFIGGRGADGFIGSANADVIIGQNGGDRLDGRGGADTFFLQEASESTSVNFDTLVGFSFAGGDRIDLPTAIARMDDAASGSLSLASFDAQLAAALTGLDAGTAALFTATGGDQNGRTFLVADGNGIAGYQAGEDYVFLLETPPPAGDINVGVFV